MREPRPRTWLGHSRARNRPLTASASRACGPLRGGGFVLGSPEGSYLSPQDRGCSTLVTAIRSSLKKSEPRPLGVSSTYAECYHHPKSPWDRTCHPPSRIAVRGGWWCKTSTKMAH